MAENSIFTLFCRCNSYAPERCHHLPLIAHNISLQPHVINIQTSAFMFFPHLPFMPGRKFLWTSAELFHYLHLNSFLRLLFSLMPKKTINQRLTAAWWCGHLSSVIFWPNTVSMFPWTLLSDCIHLLSPVLLVQVGFVSTVSLLCDCVYRDGFLTHDSFFMALG